MRITGHIAHDLSLEFQFANGHSLVVIGEKEKDNGGIERFKCANLLREDSVVGRYAPPPAKSPTLRLMEGYTKADFVAYWMAATKYFKSNTGSLLSGAMAKGDVYVMGAELEKLLPIIQDDRRAKVGPLS
ncbi:MAG TPA: hypothetical protein VFZ48_02360 [Candidatus Saccharimonadales bacterium]